MYTLISVILFAFNLVNTVDLPIKPTPKPTPDCTLDVTEYYVDDSHGLMDCENAPVPPPCNCADCDLYDFYFNCNTNCCIGDITFKSRHDNCFKACGYLDTPVAAIWYTQQPGRGAICDSASLTLINDPSKPSFCEFEHLKVKICGDEGDTINYSAHIVNGCADPAYITGFIVL